MQSKGKKRKVLYVILSILIALFIWIFADTTGTADGTPRSVTVEVEDVPVEFIGEETLAAHGLMLLEDGSDTAVTLKLEGTRWNIAKLDKSEIRLQVDLSNVTSTGIHSLTYKPVYPAPASSTTIRVVEASAYTVDVNVGELYSKEVEVQCEITGEVADGYTAGELEISPSVLEIRGQQETIAPVSYAKVVLNLDNATSTVTELLDYQFYDEQGQLIDSKGIYATAEQIQVTLPVNIVKELKLAMNFEEAPGASSQNLSYTIQPETITVSGDAELLRDMDTLVLDDFNLAALEKSTTATSYSYAIKLPEGCTNLSGVTRATLRIAFQDMTTATLTATQFTCVNVPEGCTADVITAALPVTIFGTEGDVAAVSSEEISVRVDLSNFSSAVGSYTVPAEIFVDTGGDVGISGSYQVRVSIQELEQTPEQDE